MIENSANSLFQLKDILNEVTFMDLVIKIFITDEENDYDFLMTLLNFKLQTNKKRSSTIKDSTTRVSIKNTKSIKTIKCYCRNGSY